MELHNQPDLRRRGLRHRPRRRRHAAARNEGGTHALHAHRGRVALQRLQRHHPLQHPDPRHQRHAALQRHALLLNQNRHSAREPGLRHSLRLPCGPVGALHHR